MHAPSHSQPLRRQRLFATILLTFLASIPLQIASAVSTHSEDAESGLGGVIDGSDASYALIQSDQVAQGANAFHLANPAPAATDNFFTLDVDIDVLADTKLFFQSRLQLATSYQFATVQVSHDGGSTWPDTVYSQAGTGGSGEGAFSLRTIDLGALYPGQQIRLRFYYDFTNTSAFTQTTTDVGWLVDDIQISTSFQKTLWSIGTPTATEVLYLEVINRARADALVEAARLAALTDPDIIGAYTDFGITTANIPIQFSWYVTNGCMSQFAQPLAFDAKLMETAQKHTQDMFNNMFQGHNSSASPIAPFLPGDTFGDRLSRVGWSNGAAGENVFAYAESVEYGHAGFDVDWGDDTNNLDPCYNADFAGQGMQNPSGHRTNLHNPDSKEAGIGVINGTNGSVGPQLVTQDLGSNSGAAYITGVVYDDDDSNGIYSATSDMSHEGRSGIRVDIDGSPLYAITTTSGAYALPVTANGTYTVTFSGAGIQTFVTTANITGLLNTKLDHDPVDLSGYTLWALLNGVTGATTDDDDGDTVTNLVEYSIDNMDPTLQDGGLLPNFLHDSGDGKMRYTLPKRAGATDIQYTLLISTDLVTWLPASTHSATTIETNDATELVVSANNGETALFAILQITRIP